MRKLTLSLLFITALSFADTGFKDTIQFTETDGSPKCMAGQVKVTAGTLTCNGQTATISTGGSGGGGGSSSLQITQSGVEITSPTSSMNFSGLDFLLSAVGSTSTVAIATVVTGTHTWTAPQTMRSSFTINNFLKVTTTSNLDQVNATTSTFNGSVFYQGQTNASASFVGDQLSSIDQFGGSPSFVTAKSRLHIESLGAGTSTRCPGISTGDSCFSSQKPAGGALPRNGRMFFLADNVSDGTLAPSLPYQMIVAPQGVAFNTGETGSSVAMSTPIAPVHVGYGTLMPAIVGISTMSISSASIVTDFPGNTYMIAIDSSSRTSTFFGVKAGQSVLGTSTNTWTLPTSDAAGFFKSDGSGAMSISAVDLSGANATGVLAAARFPALTGDITTVSGALATTAASGQANITNFTHTILMTSSLTVANAVRMGTAGQTVTIDSNTVLVGATFYQNGLVRIGIPGKQTTFVSDINITSGVWLNGATGTSGQVMTSGGNGAIPTWSTPAGTGDMILASTQTNTGGKIWQSTSTFLGEVIISTSLNLNGSYGNSGQFLKSNGTGAIPSWGDASGGSLTIATGTPSGFNGTATAGITTIIFDSSTLKMQPISATTAYVTLSTFTISSFTWAGPFIFTVPTSPTPIILDGFMCAGGGGGGGGNGQVAGSARGGGTGAGGGACRPFSIEVSTLGATFGVQVGTGGPGGAGGTNNSGSNGTAGGLTSIYFIGGSTLAIIYPGGFGFGNDNGDRSGGAGGGWCGVGGNGGSAATTGGCPNTTVTTNGIGGGGGGTGNGVGDGKTGDYGGAGGGAGRATAGGTAGGSSSYGGGGGGGGGGCTTGNVCGAAGNGGGNFTLTISSGGGLGGTSGAAATVGGPGNNGGWFRGGAGGGAGGSDTDSAAQNGGAGGYCGGGGGGGGAGTNVGGTGGKGGTGCVFIMPRGYY